MLGGFHGQLNSGSSSLTSEEAYKLLGLKKGDKEEVLNTNYKNLS